MTPLETEMRKRVFWTLYGLVVGLSGRLGRPMPLRLSDIDIEFPDPVYDHLPEESDLPDFRKCSFHVGIAIDKLQALSGEVYTAFYSVSGSSSRDYDANVARLEADLRTWRSSVQPELLDASRASNEQYIYALCLELYDLEFQFLLRHPLILPPNDPERFKEHLNLSREFIPKTLAVLSKLRDLNCLDAPWYTVTVFLAMIFTTLFAEDQRQEELSESDLQTLKGECMLSLSILEDFGILMGSGSRLQSSVGQIIHNVLDTLSRRVSAKTAAVVAAEALNHSQRTASVGETYGNDSSYSTTSAARSTSTEVKHEGPNGYPPPDTPTLSTAHNPYSSAGAPASVQYSTYTTASTAADASHQSTPNPYSQTPFSAGHTEQISAHQLGSQIPVLAVQPVQSTSPIYAPPGAVPYYTGQEAQTPLGNESVTAQWLRWSHTLNAFPQPAPQEYMTSTTANTLMTLSGRNGGQTAPDPASQWPLNLFNLGQHGGNPAN